MFDVLSPVVGGDDSTVVGISERSPASCERVSRCLQSECLSEKQGECYLMHPPQCATFVVKNHAHAHKDNAFWLAVCSCNSNQYQLTLFPKKTRFLYYSPLLKTLKHAPVCIFQTFY